MESLFWGVGPAIVCWLLFKQWYEESPGPQFWRHVRRVTKQRESVWGDPGQD